MNLDNPGGKGGNFISPWFMHKIFSIFQNHNNIRTLDLTIEFYDD